MKSKVYLETTIISYLTALPSRDIVHPAHQQITRDWWAQRDQFDLFVSQAVLEEATRGNADAASRRLTALEGVPVLAVGSEVSDLAEQFLQMRAIPAKAAVDAVHIAAAVVHGMDYLLTWNCTHIANAAVRSKIESRCRDLGLQPPIICTPEELMKE
jgi:predicted nucleic acid-binding protein